MTKSSDINKEKEFSLVLDSQKTHTFRRLQLGKVSIIDVVGLELSIGTPKYFGSGKYFKKIDSLNVIKV